MPRVRFLTPVATEERAYHSGDTADVSGPVASAWAKNGNAEIVKGETTETPERSATPTETRPTRKRKG